MTAPVERGAEDSKRFKISRRCRNKSIA